MSIKIGQPITNTPYWIWDDATHHYDHVVSLHTERPDKKFEVGGVFRKVLLVASGDTEEWREQNSWWAHPPFEDGKEPNITWTLRWCDLEKERRAVRIVFREVAALTPKEPT